MSAIISACGKYRYRLTRGEGRLLGFAMLNPSTADAEKNDPSIRRCLGFATREGFDGIVVGNVYAYRATKPSELKAAGWDTGPENDEYLTRMRMECDAIVCAWGTNPRLHDESHTILMLTGWRAKLWCLGKTKDGFPRHPLYVRGDQPLERFP